RARRYAVPEPRGPAFDASSVWASDGNPRSGRRHDDRIPVECEQQRLSRARVRRGAAHKRLFACGSMVLAVVSVRPKGTRLLRTQSTKTKHKMKMKYRCERSHLSYRVTRDKGESIMSLTYHHYSASVIHAPINQLHCDMHSILSVQPDLIHADV